MRRLLVSFALLGLCAPQAAWAKKGHGGGGGGAPSRAVTELMGKFKWGLSSADVIKAIADDIHAKYVELIKKEQDAYKQDLLRRSEQEEIDKIKTSLVKFD